MSKGHEWLGKVSEALASVKDVRRLAVAYLWVMGFCLAMVLAAARLSTVWLQAVVVLGAMAVFVGVGAVFVWKGYTDPDNLLAETAIRELASTQDALEAIKSGVPWQADSRPSAAEEPRQERLAGAVEEPSDVDA